MPRRARSIAPVTFFHVINRSARKLALFATGRDYRAFLRILREGLERHPMRLLSYCIMSNHWHLVVGPVDPSELSRLLHWVTTTHAVRLHRGRKTTGQGPIYQGRFKSHVVSAAADLVRVCRYVERNALTAKLVRRAQDWPWCSLSERLSAQPQLPLAVTPFLESGAWIDYVNTELTLQERLGRPVPLWPESVEIRPVPKRAKSVENRPVPLDHGTEHPPAGEGREKGRRVRGRRDQREADAHVERAKHLRVIDRPRALKPRKERRHRPALAVK